MKSGDGIPLSVHACEWPKKKWQVTKAQWTVENSINHRSSTVVGSAKAAISEMRKVHLPAMTEFLTSIGGVPSGTQIEDAEEAVKAAVWDDKERKRVWIA